MTTQYERERAARHRDEKRLLALLDAAYLALATVPADTAIALADAIAPYDLDALRKSVAYEDAENAKAEAAKAAEAARVATYDELPDAPPDTQCGREVAHNAGRWTDFQRCQNAAVKIVTAGDRWNREDVQSHAVCKTHAREALRDGIPGVGGWSKSPQHESWLRLRNERKAR